MDLLRIGDDVVNLSRLASYEDRGSGPIVLRIGDSVLSLSAEDSNRFRAFVAARCRVFDLATVDRESSVGEVVLAPPCEVGDPFLTGESDRAE